MRKSQHVLPQDDLARSGTRSGRSRVTSSRPSRRCARPTATWRRSRPTSRRASASSTSSSTSWAYNPPGKAEGFLFYTIWGAHIAASAFTAQDAHGPVRRGLILTTCRSLGILQSVPKGRPPAVDDHRPPEPTDTRAGLPVAHAETSTDTRPNPDHGDVHAVVLRPAALPLVGVRRPRAAEASRLPVQGLLRRGDPAGPGGRRADLRRHRRQGEEDRARRRRPHARRRSRWTRSTRRSPSDSRGDPAPEDAARRDLRRDDARHQGRAAAGGGRPVWRPRTSPRPSSWTRSSAPSTRRRARRSRSGSRRWLRGSRATPPTSPTRSATSSRSRSTPTRC